jgi:hypothetical protein
LLLGGDVGVGLLGDGDDRDEVLGGIVDERLQPVGRLRLLAVAEGLLVEAEELRDGRGVRLLDRQEADLGGLGEAPIFIAALNNEKSYVYDRETGVLTRPDINLETLVRQRAEQEILKGALEDGILEQAQVNAEAYLLKFFAALGFPNTIFVQDQG